MKILFTNISEEWQEQFFKETLTEYTLVFAEGPLTEELVSDHPDTNVLSVFVGSPVTKNVIAALPDLQLITTRSTGFDHIELEAAKERNIPVSNVPFYGENTVAEHAMALLLALARNLRASFERIEDAQFDYSGLRGWDVKGKQLGLIGGGHIGMNMAKMANGFGMNVVVYDIVHHDDVAQEIGFSYMDFDELLASSDVLSLHLPANEHTTHILNEEAFTKMKDGMYIINTARGELIDTSALIAALKSGKVAGAGLDVLEEEGFMKSELENIDTPRTDDQRQVTIENHVLMEMENVLVTPHNAFNSQEAVQRILDTTVENINGFLAQNPVNTVSST